MILSGKRIEQAVKDGEIEINPYSANQINPNSYNLRLAQKIKVYQNFTLDAKENNPTTDLYVPDEGMFLYPNQLYLASTIERTKTDVFAPMISGRSSIGRLGIFVHVSAGFGDVGFDGHWTLEICVIKPVKIYYGMKIAQVSFWDVLGTKVLYGENGEAKYQRNTGVEASKLYKEYQ